MTFGFVAISNFGIIQMRNKTAPPPQYVPPAQRHPSERHRYPPYNSHIGAVGPSSLSSSSAFAAMASGGSLPGRQIAFH